LLFPGHPQEAVFPVDLAVLEELEALAAVGNDRDVRLHQDFEVAALFRLPVDDEGLGAGLGFAACSAAAGAGAALAHRAREGLVLRANRLARSLAAARSDENGGDDGGGSDDQRARERVHGARLLSLSAMFTRDRSGALELVPCVHALCGHDWS